MEADKVSIYTFTLLACVFIIYFISKAVAPILVKIWEAISGLVIVTILALVVLGIYWLISFMEE